MYIVSKQILTFVLKHSKANTKFQYDPIIYLVVRNLFSIVSTFTTPTEPPFSKWFTVLIPQRLFKGLWTPKSLLLPPAFGAAGKSGSMEM